MYIILYSNGNISVVYGGLNCTYNIWKYYFILVLVQLSVARRSGSVLTQLSVARGSGSVLVQLSVARGPGSVLVQQSVADPSLVGLSPYLFFFIEMTYWDTHMTNILLRKTDLIVQIIVKFLKEFCHFYLFNFQVCECSSVRLHSTHFIYLLWRVRVLLSHNSIYSAVYWDQD